MMTADGGAQAGELIEQLAAIEHERWSSWQRWMHDQCVRDDDGSLTIPAGLVSRWERQIDTPYTDLSEREQESDREQVRRYWPLIEAIINERDALAAQVAALTAERDGLRGHLAMLHEAADRYAKAGLFPPREVIESLVVALALTTPPAGAQEHEHDWQPAGFTPHPASGGLMPTDQCRVCGAVRYPYSPDVQP